LEKENRNLSVVFKIRGAVQGVGFRPTVYRLAKEFGISGWVRNDQFGVTIKAIGLPENITAFERAVVSSPPPAARIDEVVRLETSKGGESGEFVIVTSHSEGKPETAILPDLATCNDCLREIFEPGNRRYLYPFTNCTNCGPRFTIIESLPYDRPNTSMKIFKMCPDCEAEYNDPADRRFHAQPNACPTCGPHLELCDSSGTKIAERSEAISKTAELLTRGKIIALKGIGGFQLLVDARNDEAVSTLRERKSRPTKPFAIMATDLAAVEQISFVEDEEKKLLLSHIAPILILKRKPENPAGLAKNISFSNPWYGIMLPYSPLHHILMREIGFPIVATSGNLSDEPICIDNEEAFERLGKIADFFLIHNRPIVRPMDDSVVRMAARKPIVVRAARGYAPVCVNLPESVKPVLAVGPHLKNSFAIAVRDRVFMSQHIGDLQTPEAVKVFSKSLANFRRLYEFNPQNVACDLHPDYRSTRFAGEMKIPVVQIQHHYAHALACMAENAVEPPISAIVWDGSGLGNDKTIWGGEFLEITVTSFLRKAFFKLFPLPGGETAIMEPRRTALSLLLEIFGCKSSDFPKIVSKWIERYFSENELRIMLKMLERKVNSPLTSSVGRLFDGVCALLGLYPKTSFEGEAAMALEGIAEAFDGFSVYEFKINLTENETYVVDWEPIVIGILEDLGRGIPLGRISAKFHYTLAEVIVKYLNIVQSKKVLLSGGCFQNKFLLEATIQQAEKVGIEVFRQTRIPPNDGGISLGQIIGAIRHLNVVELDGKMNSLKE